MYYDHQLFGARIKKGVTQTPFFLRKNDRLKYKKNYTEKAANIITIAVKQIQRTPFRVIWVKSWQELQENHLALISHSIF